MTYRRRHRLELGGGGGGHRIWLRQDTCYPITTKLITLLPLLQQPPYYNYYKVNRYTVNGIKNVLPFGNGHFRTSVTSQVSLESPGSIASFGEKFNRQNSLPDSEVQYHDRKSSIGSALDEERLSLQQLPVGIVMDREERRGSEEDKTPVRLFFLDASNVGIVFCV